jgi:hypothetical protein
MTNQNIIERPTGTYSPEYIRNRKGILKWRKNNPEYVTKYNREYQRNLRKDPVKYEELKMRVTTRRYLQGAWNVSYKASSALGMTRQQLADKYDMTEQQFKDMVVTHELDHILCSSWFDNEDNKHLKPFMYRHYNLQFVERKCNRTKHNYVDTNDLRIQLVIVQLELEYYNSINQYDKQSISMIESLSNKAIKLRTKIKKMYN